MVPWIFFLRYPPCGNPSSLTSTFVTTKTVNQTGQTAMILQYPQCNPLVNIPMIIPSPLFPAPGRQEGAGELADGSGKSPFGTLTGYVELLHVTTPWMASICQLKRGPQFHCLSTEKEEKHIPLSMSDRKNRIKRDRKCGEKEAAGTSNHGIYTEARPPGTARQSLR